jgi:hypothetical protein
MAVWPTVEDLAKVLNVTDVEDWQPMLDNTVAAGISKVKGDVGDWVDGTDQPDENLAAAALRMAELMALRPGSAADADKDPVYRNHIFGRRHRFGIG